MKKIILSIGLSFTIFYIFGQPGCVKWKVDNKIPDTCKVLFTDSGESSVSVVIENQQHFFYRLETTYSLFQHYIVKSEKSTKYLLGTNAEGNSTFTLTFLEVPHYEKSFTCTKEADLFYPEGGWLNFPYFLSKQTGCCSYSDYYELSTFPKNEKFLSYHTSRLEMYAQSYDRSKSQKDYAIYFGFDMCSQYLDKSNTVLGTLNYSINQELNGSVIFKAKTPNSFALTPTKLQLMENGKPIEEPAHFHKTERIIAFSDRLDFIQSFTEINNVGIIVTFMLWEEGKSGQSYEKDFKLEFVNGKILQNEIIVE